MLQGRMDEARQMLVKWSMLKPAARSMYKQMDNLLSKMPVYNVRLTYLHGPQSCYTVISFDLLTKYSFNQMLPGHLI